MTVYRRDSKDGPRWVVDFVSSGERVNRTLPGIKTKREAQAAEAKLKAEMRDRSRMGLGFSRMTLETAIHRYAAERLKPKTRNPSSLATYLSYLGMLRAHFGPETPVDSINKPAVADWWAATIQRVKPNTAKRYLTVLKAVLAFAKEAGAGNEVPTFSPTIPDDSRVRWLTEDEEASLMAAAPPWLGDLITFYLDTGARKSDALRLTWRHVHLPEAPQRGSVRFYGTKEDQPRGVPLSRRARALLERLKADRPNAKADDKVFLRPDGPDGALVPVGDFKKTWTRVRKAAGLEDVHVHDLRHTFASRLVMKRVPLFEVQRLMGHSTMKMTSRYAHLAPEAFDTAIAALD